VRRASPHRKKGPDRLTGRAHESIGVVEVTWTKRTQQQQGIEYAGSFASGLRFANGRRRSGPATMPAMHANPRNTKPSAESVTATEVPFPVWKAEVMLALVKVHERAMTVTRDGFWIRLYVRGRQRPRRASTTPRTDPIGRRRRGGDR
jgi:hypothetical protein